MASTSASTARRGPRRSIDGEERVPPWLGDAEGIKDGAPDVRRKIEPLQRRPAAVPILTETDDADDGDQRRRECPRGPRADPRARRRLAPPARDPSAHPAAPAVSRARAFSPLSASASSIQASIRSRVTGSPAATVNCRLSRIFRRASSSPKIVRWASAVRSDEDGLEQDLTDPFADRLIAGELREQRVVVLGHLRADRPCTQSRHGAGLPYVVVTHGRARRSRAPRSR